MSVLPAAVRVLVPKAHAPTLPSSQVTRGLMAGRLVPTGARGLGPKLALARTAGALSRLRGGGATSVPGKVLLRLEPHAIGLLGARLRHGSVLISATNGKTTTAAMAAAILAHDGVRACA